MNKTMSLIYMSLFVAGALFTALRYESFSQQLFVVGFGFIVVTGSLSLVYFIRSKRKSESLSVNETTPVLRQRKSWVDRMPLYALLFGGLVFAAASMTSKVIDLNDAISRIVMLVIILSLAAAFVLCTIISLDTNKERSRRTRNSTAALLLLFTISLLALLTGWV